MKMASTQIIISFGKIRQTNDALACLIEHPFASWMLSIICKIFPNNLGIYYLNFIREKKLIFKSCFTRTVNRVLAKSKMISA